MRQWLKFLGWLIEIYKKMLLASVKKNEILKTVPKVDELYETSVAFRPKEVFGTIF
jgi:hypothetical protein